MKIGIMDADSLAYQIAYYYQQELDATGFEPMEDDEDIDFDLESDDDYSWAVHKVGDYLSNLQKDLNLDKIELHVGGAGKNSDIFKAVHGQAPRDIFRYEEANNLPKAYKSNRPKETSPLYFDVMKAMILDFNAEMHDYVETDDVVVYLKNKDPENTLLIALDKDVLNQTVGIHWNYGKGAIVKTDAPSHVFYPYWQAIVGDPGDGYGGVPGIGPAKAKAFIDESMSEKELWEGVLQAYKSKNYGEKEAIATMRLASMTQLTDYKHVKDGPNEYTLTLWSPDNL